MVNRQNLDFELMWIVANTVGGALGCAIGFNLADKFGAPGLFAPSMAVLCLFIGATIGLAQWLIIRQWIKANLLWILATTAGWSIGFYTHFHVMVNVGINILVFTNTPVFLPIVFVVSSVGWGFLVGALQWLILVFEVRKAYRWLRINLWAISVSFAVTGVGLYSPPPNSEAFFPESVVKSFFMGLLGLIYSILTAGVLVKLLQHPSD